MAIIQDQAAQALEAPQDDAVSPGGWNASELPLPSGVDEKSIYYAYVTAIVIFHALAVLAFVPWFFSWTGVACFIFGTWVFGAVGIPICYHRLLTHRSFRTPKWFERILVVVALCCGQESPARWVAWHRLHHKESDHQEDPHSPLVNFFWSHFQWLVFENKNTSRFDIYQKYARDILGDPFYMWLEKKPLMPVAIFMAHAGIIYAGAFLVAGFFYGFGMEAFQLASSVFVWGVGARVVCVWHNTWAVNSLAHMFGYRNYETDDHSRNNWFVALISMGEGWHNNHHADQSAATVQHRWWEIDMNYYIIKVWSWFGLASHIVPPVHKRRLERKSAE